MNKHQNNMDIRIEAPNFSPSEALKDFVNEKVGKLFNQSSAILHAEVTMYEEGNSGAKTQVCEIRLAVPGNDHFVKKESPAFEQSILEAVDTLQKVVSRQKEKEVGQRNDA